MTTLFHDKDFFQPAVEGFRKFQDGLFHSVSSVPFPFRLGKLAARVDPRTLSAIDYCAVAVAALPPPKPAVDWISAVPSYPMYGNDVHGDCSIAAIGHMVQAWAANNGIVVTPTLDDVMSVYNVLSPYDNGCVLLDVLKYWTTHPICGVQIGAFAAVNPRNQAEFKICTEIYGGVYVGAELPQSAMEQDEWTVVSGAAGAYGGLGGHCIPFLKYDADKATCVTWGMMKDATWEWITEYVSECYVLISTRWLNGSGKTPEGLDMPTLLSDLKLVKA